MNAVKSADAVWVITRWSIQSHGDGEPRTDHAVDPSPSFASYAFPRASPRKDVRNNDAFTRQRRRRHLPDRRRSMHNALTNGRSEYLVGGRLRVRSARQQDRRTGGGEGAEGRREMSDACSDSEYLSFVTWRRHLAGGICWQLTAARTQPHKAARRN